MTDACDLPRPRESRAIRFVLFKLTRRIAVKQENKNKPQWTKPELTVLVRNKAEEAVLSTCKVLFLASGPTDFDSECMQWLGSGVCENCASLIGS
jgi:hypothetical protein